MSKSSASSVDGDETVRYEISRGSSITADDKVAFTNYLVHLPIQNYIIVEIDVDEQLSERRNFGVPVSGFRTQDSIQKI